MSHNYVEIKTDSEFKDILQERELVVILFTTSWPEQVTIIQPEFKDLSYHYPTIHFLVVDMETLEDIAQEYRVEQVPTFVFLKNGKQTAVVRDFNRSQLDAELEKLSNSTADAE